MKFVFIVIYFSWSSLFALNLAPLPAHFESWPAKNKMDYVWNTRIIPTVYDSKKIPALNTLPWMSWAWRSHHYQDSHLGLLDELKGERGKFLHTFGSVAKFKWISMSDHPFTGIFKGSEGIMRISYSGGPAVMGHVPGLALKFYRDKIPSVNGVFMSGLDSQKSSNPFIKTLSNKFEKPKNLVPSLLQWAYDLTHSSDNGRYMNLEHLAAVHPTDELELSHAPYRIYLVPTHLDALPTNTEEDFRILLSRLTPGIDLYLVKAEMKIGDALQVIGSIRLETEFVASEYGDLKLYFDHRKNIQAEDLGSDPKKLVPLSGPL